MKRKNCGILLALVLALSLSLVMTVPAIAGAPEAPVNLGTAANFAILSKSGISNAGGATVVGDIGVSPIGYAAITGFALTPAVPNGSNTYATSALVTGNVYASDYTSPTPAYLTTAVSNMEAAYTDAAGRTLPDATNLGAGDIGGMTLAPGLYKWTTGVTIPTSANLSGGASDVWIFQIAGTLTVASSVSVNMIGGGLPQNVFWQVAGQTTLDTSSVFNGNILDQTAIVLNSGATLNGRALAQTEVTLGAGAAVVQPAYTPIPPPTPTPTVGGTVGGKVYPINKAALLMPWLSLGLFLALAAGGLVLARRRSYR